MKLALKARNQAVTAQSLQSAQQQYVVTVLAVHYLQANNTLRAVANSQNPEAVFEAALFQGKFLDTKFVLYS